MKMDWHEFQVAFKDRPIFEERAIFDFFRSENPEMKVPTLRWHLFELRRKGQISRVARGLYSLRVLKPFQPDISNALKRIFNELKRELPYAEHCVWSTSWLDALIVHQPASRMIVVESEKAAVPTAFEILSGHGRASFIEPTKKEVEFYLLSAGESVVVRPLALRAPIAHIEGVNVPRIEKILVDVFIDHELFKAFQGTTLEELFRNALSEFQVDLTTLGSYAARRGRRKALREFLAALPGLSTFTEEALKWMMHD